MINRIYLWLATLGGLLLAIFAIFTRGKSAGKHQQQAKQNEDTIRIQQAIIQASKPMSVDDTIDVLRKGKF